MTDDTSCVVCRAPQETIVHILRDCHLAAAVWLKVLPSNVQGKFFSLELGEWLDANLQGQFKARGCVGKPSVLFAILC